MSKRISGIIETRLAMFIVTVVTCFSFTIVLFAEDDNIYKRERYLVLDSRVIESMDNMQLTVGVAHKNEHNPLFGEDKPWEPRFDNPYSSVIYDEEEKTYKCWYSIFTKSDYEALVPEKRAVHGLAKWLFCPC